MIGTHYPTALSMQKAPTISRTAMISRIHRLPTPTVDLASISAGGHSGKQKAKHWPILVGGVNKPWSDN